MTSKINVGLIGFGFSAKIFHLPFLQALAPYAVQKIYTTQAPEDSKYSAIQFTSRSEEIWEDPKIDLLVITSPNDLHFKHAFKALSHHKHVVVEKPFVLNVSDGERLIDLATQRQQILAVFHNRRWDSDFLTLQKLIQEGTLGDIFYVEFRFDRFRPIVKARWKEDNTPGSGILWDLGPHLIDQALQLFGSPSQIFADCVQQRPLAKTTDYFKLLFSYQTGLRVTLGGSNLSLAPGPKFVVHGTKGSFIKFGSDLQESCLMERGFEPSPHWGKEPSHSYGTLTILDEQGTLQTSTVISEQGKYQEFYENLAQSIQFQLPSPVDPTESLEVIKLINSCHQSALQNKAITL